MNTNVDACGMPLLPVGDCVTLARFYRVPIIVADGEVNYDISQTMEKDFLLRGIACDPNSAEIKVRFQVAKNYYLSAARARLKFLCRDGFYARAFEPELFLPRGEDFTIEAENSTGAAVSTYVILFGVDLEVVKHAAV